MGRKSKNKKQPLNFDNEVYWQSSRYNARLFNMYRNQIIALAMTRFRYINLPKTCNARYLERCLLFDGMATIAFPMKQKGVFYSTQVAQTGRLNVYDNPIRWRSYGNNGWNFRCDSRNGVIIWDNMTRYPMLETIDIWARELVDVTRTKQLNRMHQKIPWIIKCLQEQENQALNLFKQIAGFEPAIITTTGIESIDFDVIQSNVDFLGESLTAEEINIWNRIYQSLGIPNMPYKSERMIEDEVNNQSEPTDLMMLNSLECRREAIEVLNNRFNNYLDDEIKVVWRQDNQSDNWNFRHNITSQLSGVDTNMNLGE